MRDHDLKNQIGKIEDATADLRRRFDTISGEAYAHDADGHGELYERIVGFLATAEDELKSAYTLLLNGDEELGVEPLSDE